MSAFPDTQTGCPDNRPIHSERMKPPRGIQTRPYSVMNDRADIIALHDVKQVGRTATIFCRLVGVDCRFVRFLRFDGNMRGLTMFGDCVDAQRLFANALIAHKQTLLKVHFVSATASTPCPRWVKRLRMVRSSKGIVVGI